MFAQHRRQYFRDDVAKIIEKKSNGLRKAALIVPVRVLIMRRPDDFCDCGKRHNWLFRRELKFLSVADKRPRPAAIFVFSLRMEIFV